METTPTNSEKDGNKIPKKPSKKGNISTKDADVFNQAVDANAQWKLNPDLTLRWITQPDFEKFLTNSQINFSDRLQIGSIRPSLTSDLKTADMNIDEAVSVVKTYINKKYEKTKLAIPHYAAFGIIHTKSNNYIFPKDRDLRLRALPLMIKAITDEGFGNEKYGTTFWTDTLNSYELLVKDASTTDGLVSKKVGDKDQQLLFIKKVLNCIVGLVKINFPDTYQTELRGWGVQKEKF